jgi:hypothetical protein
MWENKLFQRFRRNCIGHIFSPISQINYNACKLWFISIRANNSGDRNNPLVGEMDKLETFHNQQRRLRK